MTNFVIILLIAIKLGRAFECTTSWLLDHGFTLKQLNAVIWFAVWIPVGAFLGLLGYIFVKDVVFALLMQIEESAFR